MNNPRTVIVQKIQINKKLVALLIVTLFLTMKIAAQNIMRPVEELINNKEPGWALVDTWIKSAKNKVEVLPVDTLKAKTALFNTQVTTRSPMGAVIYMTGGIFVDNGWIRIIGSGSQKLNRTLPDWNKGKSFDNFGEKPTFLLVADDAVGGFFALNGGQFGEDAGKIYYLSPDNLEWEPLDLTYTDFLNFCFSGDLKKFYDQLRWKNWKAEVSNLDGNMVYNFVPYLWSKEGKNIDKDSRMPVPIEEQYKFNMSMRKQLGIDK
jgi:hypothetical protein